MRTLKGKILTAGEVRIFRCVVPFDSGPGERLFFRRDQADPEHEEEEFSLLWQNKISSEEAWRITENLGDRRDQKLSI